MSNRSIIHLHIDSFFALVERQRRPELAGRPVIVAKSSGKSSGIVVSASPDTLTSGVSEGMPVRHAQRLCPEAKFVAADYQLYKDIHEEVMDIASAYSPLLEPYSLGKAYLDVTASWNIFGNAAKIAGEIKRKVKEGFDLDLTVGVASGKFAANVASTVASPGGYLEVEQGTERLFLAPLPVKLLWGVGEKAERRLADLGVQTMGQLASIPQRFLAKQFGVYGESFHRLANGIDNSVVLALYPPKIIKIEQMFPLEKNELEEPADVEAYLPDLADRLAAKLRKRGEYARTVTLKLYLAEDGPAAARVSVAAYNLKHSINSPMEISGVFQRLLYERMLPGMKVIGIGLVLSNLNLGESIAQLSLIGDKALRMKQEQVVNAIRERFGERAIFFGGSLAQDGDTPVNRLVA